MRRCARTSSVVALAVGVLALSAPFARASYFGYSAHINAQPNPDTYAALMQSGNADTVRDDIRWSSVEGTRNVYNWSGPDRIVTEAANHGLHVDLVVDMTPAWASGVSSGPNWFWHPPIHSYDYGDFASRVASRYEAGGYFWISHPAVPEVLPAGMELWNEPNLYTFWGDTTPDPARYAAMVRDAYPKVKAADPAMTVVSAGLAPAGGYDDLDCNGVPDSGRSATRENGLNYLEDLYAHGIAGHMDAVGWHPYNFPGHGTASGMLTYHRCSAWSQMSQTSPSVRSLMTANGDSATTVWATEVGAPTCIAGSKYPCVAESEQGKLAAQEMLLWKRFPWAGSYYWYDIRDDFGGTSTSNEEAHFGVVRAGNSPKPAYVALQSAWGP